MKRVIALIAAAVLIIRFFALTIYADYTYYDYLKEFWSATGDFISGEYSFSEYSSAVTAAAERWAVSPHLSSKVDAIVGNVENIVNDYGPAAVDVIKGWTSDLFSDYQVSCTVPVTDLKDGVAVLELVLADGGRNIYYSNSSGTISLSKNNILTYKLKANTLTSILQIDSYGHEAIVPGSNVTSEVIGYVNSNVSAVHIYGDWRHEDDTPAETDDEYGTLTKYDFTQKQDQNNYDPNNPNNPDNLIPTTERELEELLDSFNEALENNTPDLSSVEGSLKAIYYRLGQIDSDDDGEKLDMINATILSALQGGEKNEKLMDVLLEMREYLKNGMNGNSGDEHEIAGTLYNVKPLDKNWLNKLTTDKTELKVDYEGKTYYLESDGCLRLGDKFYHVDLNYDNYTNIDYDFSNENIVIDRSKYVDVDFKNYNNMWLSLSSTQKKKINSVVDLIYKLISQAVPYTVITSAFAPFEVIIFNTSEPKDIVLKFDDFDLFGTTVKGFSVTVLSQDFFENEHISEAISIIRGLLTVIIGYCWLISMRKKAVSMLG